ncbi:MAG TPA: hypothetical protein VFM54_19670 [Micromonosporaceae bacterium]|nr:hypothetical protein [Micromonosporaceae bacterium]
MRTRINKWLPRLVLVAVLQVVIPLFASATPALADDTSPCPTGTNWDSVTQQCR